MNKSKSISGKYKYHYPLRLRFNQKSININK